MKAKWMLVGLIMVLTACGSGNAKNDEATAAAATTTASTETKTEASDSKPTEAVPASASNAVAADPVQAEEEQVEESPEKVEDYADYNPRLVVKTVKESALSEYSSTPLGEVFDAFFSNPKWEYFKSDDDSDVVEFTGDAMYGEEEGHTTIQFLLYEDLTFELSGIWVGGESDDLDEEYSMSDSEIEDTLEIIYGLNQ